jgi:hypothetical protein
MADFARWAVACETAAWPEGTFMAAYAGNIESSVDSALEADSVGTAVLGVMASLTEWSGTAAELLARLTSEAGEKISQGKKWPKNPRAMSGRLRRASPLLRKRKIDVQFEREGLERKRVIHILNLKIERVGKFASIPSVGRSQSPRNTINGNEINDMNVPFDQDGTEEAYRPYFESDRPYDPFASVSLDANADGTDGSALTADGRDAADRPHTNQLKENAIHRHTDGTDAKFPTLSTSENEGMQPTKPAPNATSKNPQKSLKSEYRPSDPDYMPAFVPDEPSREHLSTTARAVIDFARQNNLKLRLIGGRLAFDLPAWPPERLSALYVCEREITAWLSGALPTPKRIIKLSGHARLSPQAWTALFGQPFEDNEEGI